MNHGKIKTCFLTFKLLKFKGVQLIHRGVARMAEVESFTLGSYRSQGTLCV